MATKSLCSIPDCGKTAVNSRGWCVAHYHRWQRHGDPLGGGPPATPNGEAQRYFREVVLAYDGDECLAWPYGCDRGYAQMWNTRTGKTASVSRLVCEEENGPPPTPEYEAAHSCGKGHLACVTKRHLSWKTPFDNSNDRVAHGTLPRGSLIGTSKLTESQVREIKRMQGLKSHREIAEEFGVSRAHISRIIKGVSWTWANMS